MRLVTVPQLEAGVLGLALVSLAQMLETETRGQIPPLYGGRIRYQREKPNDEDWQTALETARRGAGDCEDLAAYRVAELLKAGEKQARPRVLIISPRLRHVVVARANGRIEDPSKILGMRGAG